MTEMKSGSSLLFALALALSGVVSAHSQDTGVVEFQSNLVDPASVPSSGTSASPSASSTNRITATRYSIQFAGDHSLNSATVTEDVSSRFTVYAVRLQFASGAEQSF